MIRPSDQRTYVYPMHFSIHHFFHTETKSHWCDSVSAAVLIGVKVPITSSVYGYTKVLAHNLNSKKTSGAAIG